MTDSPVENEMTNSLVEKTMIYSSAKDIQTSIRKGDTHTTKDTKLSQSKYIAKDTKRSQRYKEINR